MAGGGAGSAKRKWFVTLKSSFTIYENEEFRLSLKHQLNYVFMVIIVVKLEVELLKCIYLASMGVKIEHTVGIQNKDFFKIYI